MIEDNPVLKAIANRSSIRSYQDKPVPKELIIEVIRAGMAAPSGKNVQPWVFMVIEDRDVRKGIADVIPNGSILPDVPVAIMVGADLFIADAGTPGYEYWTLDCSAATMNMLLAAEAVGLGALWVGVKPIQERVENVSKVLRLPRHIVPLCLVVLGYPKQPGQPKDKFQENRIHWGRWQAIHETKLNGSNL